jgi:hypothetical protein
MSSCLGYVGQAIVFYLHSPRLEPLTKSQT